MSHRGATVDGTTNRSKEPRLSPSPTTATNLDAELLQWVRVAVQAADDKQGRNTEAFFVGEILGITDWFVVTSGGSARQVRAIMEAVEEEVAKAGGPKPLRIEGQETLSWVLMDYGAFVVHVFSAETRDYYDLERLWKDVPRLTDVA